MSLWSLISNFFSVYRRLKIAGLTNFYASRTDYEKYRGAPRLIDYLNLASESIEIAAYWMAHGNEAEGIAEDISKLVKPPREINVTIAIIHPKSIYLDELANYININSKELKMRIESSLMNLYKAKEKLSLEEKKDLL